NSPSSSRESHRPLPQTAVARYIQGSKFGDQGRKYRLEEFMNQGPSLSTKFNKSGEGKHTWKKPLAWKLTFGLAFEPQKHATQLEILLQEKRVPTNLQKIALFTCESKKSALGGGTKRCTLFCSDFEIDSVNLEVFRALQPIRPNRGWIERDLVYRLN
ncbi:hypothetical protein KI387_012621, partial [Taxus chinensis]